MDIADVVVIPSVIVGMAISPAIVRYLTDWSIGASIAVGMLPGAFLGFGIAICIFYGLGWIASIFSRNQHDAIEKEKI
jgi:hypothetical protein